MLSETASTDWSIRTMKEPKESDLMALLDPFLNTWQTDMRQVVKDIK